MLSRFLNNRNVLGMLFMAPAVILLVVFLTYPLGLGVWLAFTDATIGRPGDYVGLDNYWRVVTAESGPEALRAAEAAVLRKQFPAHDNPSPAEYGGRSPAGKDGRGSKPACAGLDGPSAWPVSGQAGRRP